MRSLLAVFTFILLCGYAQSALATGHEHLEYTFDSLPPSWQVWTPWSTETHGASLYLGDFDDEVVRLLVYDMFSPAAESNTVNLSFDFITLGGPSPATLEIVQLQGANTNGTVYSTTVGLVTSTESHNVSFPPLVYDYFNGTSDFEFTFTVTGLDGATWGLDNVILDWSAIPAPVPTLSRLGALVVVGLLGFLGYRRSRVRK